MRMLLLLSCFAMGCNTTHPVDTTSIDNNDTLALFEPGLISDGFDNRDLTMSPDGRELYYTIQYENQRSIIMRAVYSNDQWGEPKIASFSGTYKDLEAAYHPNGNEIYFASNRPLQADSVAGDYNIWRITRTGSGWSEPMALDSTINTSKDEFFPSISTNGNLYFTRDNGATLEDIWLAIRDGNSYRSVAPMSDAVNSKGYDFNAFINPNEEFIIFTSYKRADDLGSGDLYISRKKNGEWQPAVHLDERINSTAIDYCPFMSPDGRFFFFTSSRINSSMPRDSVRTKTDLVKFLGRAGNGSDDIYRVPATELEKFY